VSLLSLLDGAGVRTCISCGWHNHRTSAARGALAVYAVLVGAQGTLPWHQLPATIISADCGIARRWYAHDLIMRRYHCWRMAPQELPALQGAPAPWNAYMDHDI